MESRPLVEIEALDFGYGKTALFRQLNLEVLPGLYGLLGRNGAGKSTLLKIIAGQLYPQGGRCLTLGADPSRRLPAMLEDLFYLPEEFYLPEMEGQRYLELHAPFYPRFDEAAFRENLRLFEVDPGKRLSSLSYGQRKKFLISFALASGTSLLLLDEPTNGLDIPSKSQFRQAVAAADLETRGVLISTHQVRDMENLIDPIIIVEAGRIILNNSMEEITGSFHISLQKSEPDPEEAVYWEKVLGGYSVVSRGPDTEGNGMDLEFLFNMAVAKGNPLKTLYHEGVNNNEE